MPELEYVKEARGWILHTVNPREYERCFICKKVFFSETEKFFYCRRDDLSFCEKCEELLKCEPLKEHEHWNIIKVKSIEAI